MNLSIDSNDLNTHNNRIVLYGDTGVELNMTLLAFTSGGHYSQERDKQEWRGGKCQCVHNKSGLTDHASCIMCHKVACPPAVLGLSLRNGMYS